MPYIFRAYPMHIPCRSHTHSIHIPCLFHACCMRIPWDSKRSHEIPWDFKMLRPSLVCVFSDPTLCALLRPVGGHLRHYLGSPRRGSRGHAEGPARDALLRRSCGHLRDNLGSPRMGSMGTQKAFQVEVFFAIPIVEFFWCGLELCVFIQWLVWVLRINQLTHIYIYIYIYIYI